MMNSQSGCRSANNFNQLPTQYPTQSNETIAPSASLHYPPQRTGTFTSNGEMNKVPLPTSKTGGSAKKSNIKEVGPKADWQPHLVEKYIRMCVAEANKGNRPGAHFTKHGWQNLVVKFQLSTGLKYTRTELKNKWDAMRKEWGYWKALIGKDTGLGWDHIRCTIDATPEWWERKLKVTPEAAKFRTKGPILLDEKEILFAGNVASGEETWAPSSGILPEHMQPDTQDNMEETYGGEEEGDEEQVKDDFNIDAQPDLHGSQPLESPDIIEPPRTASFKSKKVRMKVTKKLTTAQQVVKCLDKMVDKIDTVTSSTPTGGCSCTNALTGYVTECLTILGTMNGVEAGGKLWLYATRVLLKPNVREMFVGLPSNDLRLVWLLDHMERDMNKRENYVTTNYSAGGQRGFSGESAFGSSS